MCMTLFNIARGLITAMMHNEYSFEARRSSLCACFSYFFFSHLWWCFAVRDRTYTTSPGMLSDSVPWDNGGVRPCCGEVTGMADGRHE